MIGVRILDNDMGHVAKVPLTGRGTVHGVTVRLDIPKDKTSERVTLPEFDVGIVELVSEDMAIRRFETHCEEHIGDLKTEALFVEAYRKWATPINKSGKNRY